MTSVAVKEDRPAYVRFEKRDVEDRNASIQKGHYVSKDIDFAIITPHGSKDQVVRVATEWLDMLEAEVRNERLPAKWCEMYKEAYARYKKGEEMPLQGTPIKGWPLLSPAQQKNLIALNIMTVEDLANMNEASKAMIGLGAVEMQKKAENWLESAKNIGTVVAQITALRTDLDQLRDQNKSQGELIAELRAENKRLKERQGVEA